MRAPELTWSVAKLIDLEYALLREPAKGPAAKHRRDREIYKSSLSNSPARLHENRCSAFAYWLEAVTFPLPPYQPKVGSPGLKG